MRFLYGSGAYLASPKDTTDLFQSPTGPYSVLRVSVPDVFSVKGGMGYTLWPRYGVTATLGARLDGIPIHDVFGASHGFRRPALIGFVDPSISISRGDSTFQIDVPVRIFYNFRRSEPDVALGRPGGGDRTLRRRSMTFEPGAHIGPYVVERSIGAGGMGRVFRVYDPRLERRVALKVLSTQGSDDEARQRLLAEARSASALNHPHICTVYEVGEHDGSPFIAMEFIDGPDLHVRLLKGPLAVGEAIRLIWQVADALAHAHARHVIHRDLKAANVMVSAGDRVKVVDFGLAQRVLVPGTGTETETMAPAIVGTLASMAPEQIRGEPLDARCDVWAIGVLLHEMLAGSRPFQGTNPFELSHRILQGDAAPLPEDGPPSGEAHHPDVPGARSGFPLSRRTRGSCGAGGHRGSPG